MVDIVVLEEDPSVITSSRVLSVQGVKVFETYEDGKLVRQVWESKPGFSPASFLYYEDISFLDSLVGTWMVHKDTHPIHGLVTDWGSFKGLGHVISFEKLSTEGLFNLESDDPVPVWRRWPSFRRLSEFEYDLVKLESYLMTLSFVRNIKYLVTESYSDSVSSDFDRLSYAYLTFEYKAATPLAQSNYSEYLGLSQFRI